MSEIAELLERFRRGGELIAVVTTGVAGAETDFAPAPGKWSIRQIVCHLADADLVGADRFRRVIAEENPTLVWFDQDAWAEKLDYRTRKLSHALDMFRRIRAESYELLKGLSEEQYARTGTHSKDGTVSLLDLLRHFAKHAEGHARQIQEVRVAYKERSSAQ